MGDQDLEPHLSPRQLRAQQQAKIEEAKNTALEIGLTAIADDLVRRRDNGTLAKDIKQMKTGAILGQLTRIAAAIKQATVIAVGTGQPQRDPTTLKAQSAVHLSDHERAERRKKAEAVDAEIVEPE